MYNLIEIVYEYSPCKITAIVALVCKLYTLKIGQAVSQVYSIIS